MGDVVVRIKGDATGLQKEVKKAHAALKLFAKMTTTEVGRNQLAWSGLKKAVSVVSAAVGQLYFVAKDFFVMSIVKGAEFEQSIRTTAAVATKAGAQMIRVEQDLSDAARKMARESAFSHKQVADAMLRYAQAGFDAQSIIKGTDAAIKIAGVTMTNLATTTRLMAGTMKQFGLDMNKAGDIADTFTVATTNSLLSLEGLTLAMRYAGPVGASLGWTLQETASSIAMFADLGLTGNLVGTHLRMAMGALMVVAGKTKSQYDDLNDSMKEATKEFKNSNVTLDKQQRLLKSLGLSVDDINPAYHTLGEIIKTLAESDFSSAMDASILFTRRAAGDMGTLIELYRSGQKNFGDYMTLMENRHGMAAAIYAKILDTVLNQWKIFKSKIEDLGIEIFEMIDQDLNQALKVANAVMVSILEKVIKNRGTITSFLQDVISLITEAVPVIYKISTVTLNIIMYIVQIGAILKGLGGLLSSLLSMEISAANFLYAALIKGDLELRKIVSDAKVLFWGFLESTVKKLVNISDDACYFLEKVFFLGSGTIKKARKHIKDFFRDSVVDATDASKELETKIKKAEVSYTLAAHTVAVAAHDGIAMLKKDFNDMISIEKFRVKMNAMLDVFKKVGYEIGKEVTEIADTINNKGKQSSAEQQAFFEDMAKATHNEMNDLEKAFAASNKWFKQNRTAMKVWGDAGKAMWKGFSDLVGDIIQDFKNLGGEGKNFFDVLTTYQNDFKGSMQQAVIDIQSSFQNGILSMIRGTGDLGDVWNNVWISMVSNAEKLLADFITDFFFNHFLKSIFEGFGLLGDGQFNLFKPSTWTSGSFFSGGTGTGSTNRKAIPKGKTKPDTDWGQIAGKIGLSALVGGLASGSWGGAAVGGGLGLLGLGGLAGGSEKMGTGIGKIWDWGKSLLGLGAKASIAPAVVPATIAPTMHLGGASAVGMTLPTPHLSTLTGAGGGAEAAGAGAGGIFSSAWFSSAMSAAAIAFAVTGVSKIIGVLWEGFFGGESDEEREQRIEYEKYMMELARLQKHEIVSKRSVQQIALLKSIASSGAKTAVSSVTATNLAYQRPGIVLDANNQMSIVGGRPVGMIGMDRGGVIPRLVGGRPVGHTGRGGMPIMAHAEEAIIPLKKVPEIFRQIISGGKISHSPTPRIQPSRIPVTGGGAISGGSGSGGGGGIVVTIHNHAPIYGVDDMDKLVRGSLKKAVDRETRLMRSVSSRG